jgi:type II secretory pathway pseudopilin PulG
MTAVEAALTFAIAGSVAAVALPAFARNLRASKLAEAVDGVSTLAESATAYARAHDPSHAYPASAPLTPSQPPRGVRAEDPAGAWDHPTWRALGFRAAPEGVPHAFAFAFDSTARAGRSEFVATAHGDLDGDGVTSTFEVRGHDAAGEPGPVVEPGMVVDAEVE